MLFYKPLIFLMIIFINIVLIRRLTYIRITRFSYKLRKQKDFKEDEKYQTSYIVTGIKVTETETRDGQQRRSIFISSSCYQPVLLVVFPIRYSEKILGFTRNHSLNDL